MNVDASFSKETGEATAGIPVHDHLGTVVLAASIQLQTCRDAEEAEANAVGAGLNLAKLNGLKMDNLESDSALGVSSLNNLVPNASIHWHV
jgi:ribonuclease HI